MPLVYLPRRCDFFLWGEERDVGALRSVAAATEKLEIVVPARRRTAGSAFRREVVDGRVLSLLDGVARLVTLPAPEVPRMPPSIAVWALASKVALDLIARERVVPAIRRNGTVRACWRAALSSAEDVERVRALGASMPPAAHAVPVGDTAAVWPPAELLREFLDAVVDAFVRCSASETRDLARRSRTATGRRALRARRAEPAPDESTPPWEDRWRDALAGADPAFEPRGFAERTLADDLDAWSRPALGDGDRLRACFRLELPANDDAAFVLRFLLQSPDDPSLLVTAAEVWNAKGRSLSKLGRAFRDPQESLLEALGRAARLFPPIADSLAEAAPESLTLAPSAAWQFLDDGAAALGEAGFSVIVPAELTAAGRRRLRLRMKIGAPAKTAGAVTGAAGFSFSDVLAFQWEAAVGDATLTARELEALAKQKAPLVRYRGQWVAIDPRELAEIRAQLADRSGEIAARTALVAALAGSVRHDGRDVPVSAVGALSQVLQRVRESAESTADRAAPRTFRGTLRPYQARGVAWLATLADLGLGACLADDMGLGKTIQLLAFLLRRLDAVPKDRRPALLVAPTSVVGNWEREVARFAPSLRVVRHYGAERARDESGIPREPGTLIVTTYGLLRRDAALLSSIDWSAAVLDEAQNIKNSASATAKAARSLRATHRFALTGTPVENRLSELWSILEFANPGLLGPLETFRRELALPIERYGNDAAAQRLRRIVGPFVLRRLKSDPTIIDDLPAKNEMKVVCTLTREQATLYRAVVDEEMRHIEESSGIERHGRVLALVIFLKQICNHPAHYLGEAGPLSRRSGKLERLGDMLDEAAAAGDKALVFTQFREMGERLVASVRERLDVDVAFLHGGTPRKRRDELVRSFQEERQGPRVFVLSLKAGGTGLNLTAASHVFHFDRWWNPAVEDQATDRAYRIGQCRAVQVHKLVCAGTVEEKIDRLLEQKRGLAAKIVGAGENWITELGNAELRELFVLATDVAVADEEEMVS